MRTVIIVVVLALAGIGAGAYFWLGGTAGPLRTQTGDAGFRMGFTTASDHVLAGVSIYMRVLDLQGRPVYTTEVTTDEAGMADFKGLPAGDFEVEFSHEVHGRSKVPADLRQFTGPNAGKLLGTCVF
jgi:hypothetical protein